MVMKKKEERSKKTHVSLICVCCARESRGRANKIAQVSSSFSFDCVVLFLPAFCVFFE